jgi:hypothetical protein
MTFKEKLEEYKTLIGATVLIVTTTVGVLAWGSDVLKDREVIQQAQVMLVQDDYYQHSRITRKEDQIAEHQRQLNTILLDVGDKQPTPRQSREIAYLDQEIARLRKEIEEIRVLIAKPNE